MTDEAFLLHPGFPAIAVAGQHVSGDHWIGRGDGVDAIVRLTHCDTQIGGGLNRSRERSQSP